jgi:hypothetical protein
MFGNAQTGRLRGNIFWVRSACEGAVEFIPVISFVCLPAGSPVSTKRRERPAPPFVGNRRKDIMQPVRSTP